MAAELGQRMLEKNDDLQEQLEGLRQENLNIVQVRMGNNHSSYCTVATVQCYSTFINSLITICCDMALITTPWASTCKTNVPTVFSSRQRIPQAQHTETHYPNPHTETLTHSLRP